MPLRDDFNGEEQEGLGVYQLTQKNGQRWSAARAYLQPHIGRRDNLRVECGARVRKILFEGRRAVGVEYRAEWRGPPVARPRVKSSSAPARCNRRRS